jgi:hypothetical protein
MHADESSDLRKLRHELVKDIAMIAFVFGFGWVVPFLPIFIEDVSSLTGGEPKRLDFWLIWGAAGYVVLKLVVSDYMKTKKEALQEGASL